MNTIYIAGPMRGIKSFNFPAFHEAEESLSAQGWRVLSPASKDVAEGFDPDAPHVLTQDDMDRWIKRDIKMVLESDAIALLPGWHKSKGALVELAIARFANKGVYIYPDMIEYTEDKMVHIKDNDVLLEAYKLTTGDRQATYGSPDQDFARTAQMWGALKGVKFTTRDVAMFLICIKLSRETHQQKRDNWVDIAGYARCGDLCRQEAEKRGEE